MIVRIATEGQYDLAEEAKSTLDELDDSVVKACEAGDDAEFHRTFGLLLDLVRTQGRPIGDDQLVGSDLILPPPDVTLEEAREEFTGEGLIPG